LSNSYTSQEQTPQTPAVMTIPEPMSLRDLSKVVLRCRRLVLICFVLGVLLAIVSYVMPNRLYKATSTIELLKRGGSAVGVGVDRVDAPSDALDFNLSLQTQIYILTSSVLAVQVIDDLHLLQTDREIMKVFKAGGVAPSSGFGGLSPSQQEEVLKTFQKRLHVDAVGGTRLITVAYEDREPAKAAEIVNRLVQNYLAFDQKQIRQADSEVSGQLQEPLQQLKTQAEASQQKLTSLQKEVGIYGPDDLHNILSERLQELNAELGSSEAALVQKGAIYRATLSGNPDLAAGLVNTGFNSTGINPTLTLLQNLKEQENEAQANLATLTTKFGPNYPRVIEARKRLTTIEAERTSEDEKLRSRAETEYQVAKSVRDTAKRNLVSEQDILSKLNERAVDYSLAKREADAKNALYQQLLAKLTEAHALNGLASNEISIIDRARVPSHPASPSLALSVALPVAALVIGLVLAFLFDFIDGTVRDPDEAERVTGTMMLGTIPASHAVSSAIKGGDFASAAAVESFRSAVLSGGGRVGDRVEGLRDGIIRTCKPGAVVAVTSPLGGEGRSFVLLNLALSFSEVGYRVLIVDADYRRCKLSRKFAMGDNLDNRRTEEIALSRAVATSVANVSILPAQEAPGMLSNIRGIESLRHVFAEAKGRFDVILVSSPPLLAAAETLTISSLADCTLVVLRFGKTTRTSLVQSQRLLRANEIGGVGFILNGMDTRGPDFTDRAGDRGYSYGQS
jgi:succinoglycan biosynthesis transport protein ExoP